MAKTLKKAKKTTKVVKKSASKANPKQSDSTQQEHAISVLSPSHMEDINNFLKDSIEIFREISENDMTLSQRRRKVGAGVRNYGFIDKVSDIAAANPEFAKFFRISDLKNCIRNVEACRDIIILLQTLARMVSNTMMVYSDAAYSMALLYYNSARELARRGNPNAIEVFRTLQIFFKRHHRGTAEPTAKEIERDIHGLMRGTKDGKIIIENEKPRVVGGKRLVVDRTRSNKNAYKEVEQGEEIA